jgi:predicted DNA-binding protein
MSKPRHKSTTITFSLPVEDAEWLKDHAWVTRRSVSQIIREQVEHLRREADNPQIRHLAGKLAALGDGQS